MRYSQGLCMRKYITPKQYQFYDTLDLYKKFIGALQKISVKETAEVGTMVGRLINAIDLDKNPSIFYHIISENGFTSRTKTFSLRGTDILIEEELDRETTDR